MLLKLCTEVKRHNKNSAAQWIERGFSTAHALGEEENKHMIWGCDAQRTPSLFKKKWDQIGVNFLRRCRILHHFHQLDALPVWSVPPLGWNLSSNDWTSVINWRKAAKKEAGCSSFLFRLSFTTPQYLSAQKPQRLHWASHIWPPWLHHFQINFCPLTGDSVTVKPGSVSFAVRLNVISHCWLSLQSSYHQFKSLL